MNEKKILKYKFLHKYYYYIFYINPSHDFETYFSISTYNNNKREQLNTIILTMHIV